MLITKREEVTKQGFCEILWRKLRPRGNLLLEFIHSKWLAWGWALIWVWLGGGVGGCLFEAGRLLTFSAFRIGAYSRWALIRGSALIRKNTSLQPNVCTFFPLGFSCCPYYRGVRYSEVFARREYFHQILWSVQFYIIGDSESIR